MMSRPLPTRRQAILICVFVSVMRNFGFAECLVSEADILDGLIASQAAGEASFRSL